ncbi:MAG TPA: M3 family metallopeptidase [Steroidobacteraceae bacterium]|jgi:oligopeptidase A|nr:M3 family metallopeptidase [Steroidobacteraceae bacterium]
MNDLDGTRLPSFDQFRADAVEPAIRELLERSRGEVASLETQPHPTFENTVLPLEQLSHRLSRTWSPVSHLNGVLNSDELRASYNACLPLLTNYWTDLAQSEPLYRAYSAIASSESGSLDGAQRRVLERALEDFRLAGVGLPAEKKQRFKQVMQELAQLGAKFEENVLDAMNAWSRRVTDPAELAGINPVIVEQARARAASQGVEGWVFLLEQPAYVAVMQDADSEKLRRDFYEAWSTRASDRGPSAGKYDNTQVMARILALRHEAARLLDFPNFAAYALATRMAPSTDAVFDFLRELARVAKPAAAREFADLEAFAGRRLNAWDVPYYAEKMQASLFSISQEELRPYFPLARVLAGLFAVAERLFGVKIVERSGVPVWHADARFFEIRDGAGKTLAGFYLDACARPKKRAGAWMDDCVGRKDFGTEHTIPVAYLVCNFLPASPGKPPLLTHDDVVTMFHEFGHGLHHMLTRVGYPSIAGINGVSWDAVELPSQFMENFAWRPEVLADMARHHETGEPLPADKQARLLGSRTFQAGLATMRQLEFALFDFRLHAEYEPARGPRVDEILASVRAEVAVFAVPEWNRFPHNFAHIFSGGYAAGYYSYKWAEVLAADAFSAFEERGVFDRAVAQRFLDSILSQGGSRKALDAFVDFRGRPPDVKALLRQQGLDS